MIKHPVVDSPKHKRHAAALADRYFREQQVTLAARPDDAKARRADRAERKARAAMRDLTAAQYEQIVLAGIEKKALIQERMEARIALRRLAAMARGKRNSAA